MDHLTTALKSLSAEFNQVWGGHHETIAALVHKHGLHDAGPQTGDVAPDFALPSAEGSLKTLSQLLGQGSLYLVFVRGLWCPFCTAQITAIGQIANALQASQIHVAIVTPETSGGASHTKSKLPENVDVLCDPHSGLALRYGSILALPETESAFLREKGVDLPTRYGTGMYAMPLARSFLINNAKMIVERSSLPDQRTRHDPSTLLPADFDARSHPHKTVT